MRTFPGRGAGILVLLLFSQFSLMAQEEPGVQVYAGTWYPTDWDGAKSIIAGITRIEILSQDAGYSVTVHWISQGWPTRFRGTSVEEKDQLKVIIETTNHGAGRADYWTMDEKGHLVAWGKSFKKYLPGVAPGYKGM